MVFKFNKETYPVDQIKDFAECVMKNVTNKAIFIPSDVQITKAEIKQDNSIADTMKNFKVTPYEEVAERLNEATKNTIERLDK